jgi:hypothetical protein
VRKETLCAVFSSLGGIPETAAALVSQHIQGTVAKKAIEIIRIRSCMTGKVFTLLMAEIGIISS